MHSKRGDEQVCVVKLVRLPACAVSLGHMHWLTLALALIGSLLFLAGYLRLIADDKGHVNLNQYRFTGGLGMALTGVATGLRDLVSREWSRESLSAALMLGGAVLAALAFWCS